RLRALHRRRPAGRTSEPGVAGLTWDRESGAIHWRDEILELAPREAALLQALLARPGHAVPKERLFELVFPGEVDVQYEAIEVVVAANAVTLYRQTLGAVNTAYDRTLLASAKSIGEQLDVQGYDEDAHLRATVPYSALEAFEADVQTRMYYRVSDLQGRLVSGF